MNNLVSREEVTDLLKELADEQGMIDLHEALAYLNDLTDYEQCVSSVSDSEAYKEGFHDAESMQRWNTGKDISIGMNLVTKIQKSGELQVAIGHWSGDSWSGNGNFKNVIAWMPLPDPYIGEAK